jgi:hypothetical protein
MARESQGAAFLTIAVLRGRPSTTTDALIVPKQLRQRHHRGAVDSLNLVARPARND